MIVSSVFFFFLVQIPDSGQVSHALINSPTPLSTPIYLNVLEITQKRGRTTLS